MNKTLHEYSILFINLSKKCIVWSYHTADYSHGWRGGSFLGFLPCQMPLATETLLNNPSHNVDKSIIICKLSSEESACQVPPGPPEHHLYIDVWQAPCKHLVILTFCYFYFSIVNANSRRKATHYSYVMTFMCHGCRTPSMYIIIMNVHTNNDKYQSGIARTEHEGLATIMCTCYVAYLELGYNMNSW